MEVPRGPVGRLGSLGPSSTQALDLKFVTVSHPDDLHQHKDVRTEIRRHVMKEIGRQRRRPRAKTNKKSSLPSGSESSPETIHDTASEPRSTGTCREVNSPGRCLPTLGSFPVAADNRVIELVRFLNEQSTLYQPFRGIWFKIALLDKGAFYMTLGNAADLWLRLHGGADLYRNPEMLKYYTNSVTHLRERLTSAAENTSDGVIAHILAHLCLCMRRQDWMTWKTHMDGLQTIVTLRGGLDGLGNAMNAWVLLSDLGGSIVYDIPPLFPLLSQERLLSSHSPYSQRPSSHLQGLLELKQNSSSKAPFGEALGRISIVVDAVNINSHDPQFWQRDTEALDLLGPCIHFLLSMPRLPDDIDTLPEPSDFIAREMVRLVGLLLLSKLKELFSLGTPEQETLSHRLATFMSSYAGRLGSAYRILKIWALVTSSLLQARDGKRLYEREIRREMTLSGLEAIDDPIKVAREIIWVDALESAGADELAQDLQSTKICLRGHCQKHPGASIT